MKVLLDESEGCFGTRSGKRVVFEVVDIVRARSGMGRAPVAGGARRPAWAVSRVGVGARVEGALDFGIGVRVDVAVRVEVAVAWRELVLGTPSGPHLLQQ